jgi:hypothetical protein
LREAVATGDDEDRNPTLVDYIEPYLDSEQRQKREGDG